MTLTSTLQTALSGLNAAQRALGVTANNVANVNTEGFSRKQANQSTRLVEGVGFGVDSAETTRTVDEFLSVEIRKQLGVLGRTDALSTILEQAQARIIGAPGEGDLGFANKFTDLLASIEAAAATPENTAARSSAIGRIEDLIQEIGRAADSVQQLRSDIDRQVELTIDSINADIQTLTRLNEQFARALPTPELLDQRDQVLRDLSEKIDISVFRQDNLAVAVYTSTGAALLEYGPKTLVYTPAAGVGEDTVFDAIEIYDERQLDPSTGSPLAGETGVELVSSGIRMELTPELQADAVPDADQLIVSPMTTGKLQGLLEARDRAMPQLADQLDEIATMLRFNANKAHNDAVPHPLPTELIGSRAGLDDFDAAAAAGDATGEAYLAVVDASGAVVADITIDLSLYATADALAADLDASLTGFGDAVITADDRMEITLGNDPGGAPYRLAISEGTSAITYTDVNGRDWTYGLNHYLGMNDLVTLEGTRATEMALRPDIAADHSLLSRVALDRSTGVSLVGGAGDNRGLQGLATDLRAEFTTIDRGTLSGRPVTISDYISDVIGSQAAAAAEADNRAAADRALADELLQRHGSISGVNLDEELSKLIVYQRAYVVSARVMTVTDELFEELLGVGR